MYRLYCSLSILCTGCACQLIIKGNDDDDDDDDGRDIDSSAADIRRRL